MEILANIVSSCVVEVGRFMCKCIYPKIENTVHFSSKIENLREEMERLTKLRDDIKGKVEGAEGEGYKPKPDVIKWIEDVHELENEWETKQGSITTAKRLIYKCCPNCSLRSVVSTQAQNIRDQVCRLKEVGESFGSNLMKENYQVKKVEYLPVTSVKDQQAATRNLNQILQYLDDDKVCIIGVWGSGGIGKTTLVKNLNNELRQIGVSRPKLSFGVVVWITMPKPTDASKVQAQIASRLNLNVDNKGSVESIASKIYERLKQEKRFLLILDDVWEAINLDHVGVPQPKDQPGSKIIITSRFLGVCKKMRTDTEMNIFTLDEHESWQLFIKHAGDVAKCEDIQPLAMDIARECDGLPLAITVIGASMRGKKMVEQWVDALDSLKMSEPYDTYVRDKVYKIIKLSFDNLGYPDVELSSEQRSTMNKRRGDIQSCFLYCSLYPEAIPTSDLICCWWAEGFLGEHDTYGKAYIRGITMIETLKDACLLEKAQQRDSLKMHDVVRDVAIWIANSSKDEHNSLIQAGISSTEISHTKVSASVKRISFMSNKIKCLPVCFVECPETTSLLLQENPLVKIPDELFLAFPALRVLNVSRTGITALPSSINSLCQLRALILQKCYYLKELPPIGHLRNLLMLDCDNTVLRCLPQGMDKLTNLRLLNMPAANLGSSIIEGFFLKPSSIEMINMMESYLGSTSFDEISSLHNLTSLFIRLDSSAIFHRDHTWMKRLKKFQIEIGDTPMMKRFQIDIGDNPMMIPFKSSNKSRRIMSVFGCEIFSNGELSGMLQFASDLYLEGCKGIRKLIAHNSFDGLKSVHIFRCFCDFRHNHSEEGSGQFDPLPNLEHLSLIRLNKLESVSDFGQLLGLRFSKLRLLNISLCHSLTCLFNVEGTFSVPEHLEELVIDDCSKLVELFAQCSSSQTTVVNSEIQKLHLEKLPNLETFGEPQSIWEHLEELKVKRCHRLRKLPLSIQTSNNIKLIEGLEAWWRQLQWDNDNYKRNLEKYFAKSYR